MNQAEFFQQHAVDGNVPPEKMAEFLALPEGDSAQAQSGTPDPAPSPGAAASSPTPPSDAAGGDSKDLAGSDGKAAGVADPTLTRDNAVILTRDGKHTIGYEKLEEAREKARVAEAEAQRLREENERLTAARTPAPPAPAPAAAPAVPEALKGVPQELLDQVDFGDFSDEAVKKAVLQAADLMTTAKVNEKLASLNLGRLDELQKQAEESKVTKAVEAHFAPIYKAHPDADSIVESREFEAWKAGQPAFIQSSIAHAMTNGAPADVVAVFDSFKSATGKAGAASTDPAATTAGTEDAAAAAKAAIDSTKSRPPVSLSDIPAGTAGHTDPVEAARAQTATQVMHSFAGKDPREIMNSLERLV